MNTGRTRLGRLASEYGIVLALLVLCAGFSAATLAEQSPDGAAGGDDVVRRVVREYGPGAKVVVVAGFGQDDVAFADAVRVGLEREGVEPLNVVRGHPSAARQILARLASGGYRPDAIAVSRTAARW